MGLAFLLALAVSAHSEDFASGLARGRALRADGRADEARLALTGALALKPDDDQALAELGALDGESGRFEAAAREFSAALRRPRDYWLRIQLAQCDIQLGRLDDARKEFARARDVDVREKTSYIMEGYMDHMAGQGKRAQRVFQDLIDIDMTGPYGYHHMGGVLQDDGRNREAEEYYRKALARYDAQPRVDEVQRLHALSNLGDVELAQNRVEEAEAAYKRGLSTGPISIEQSDFQAKFLQSLGSIYSLRGSTVAAEDFFKRGAAVCAAPRTCPYLSRLVLLDWARFEVDHGRKIEAAALADRVRDFWENSTLSILMNGRELVKLGLIYSSLDDARQAEAAFDRLLPLRKTAPSSKTLAEAEEGLADLYAARGKRAQAADLYRQAEAIFLKAGDRTHAAHH